MKKSTLAIMAVFALMGTACTADNLFSGIQNDFSNARNSIQQDVNNINSQKTRGSDSPFSLQDEIDQIKAEKAKELEPINKQIASKEAQMRKVLVDTKLSVSQKKAKTSLLQKDISTLKTQKENIEAKYRKKIQEFRYY